ncbi:hypothetical protein ACIPXV_03035 [Streptomyces libani]|uniref:hypothetical protein n=1 Tax=Streptomyces nigrescens TaxID=1920 RepID=UPI00382E107A
MSTYEPLSRDNRAALAELIGDAACPAPADFLLRLGHTLKDCRTHDHGTGEDIFCGNLAGWMGERMALVMRRLLDAEAELEKYVGKEPTVAEEMQHLNRCLDAVYAVVEEAKRGAQRWENPLPVPEWVAAVEQAADGNRPTSRPSCGRDLGPGYHCQRAAGHSGDCEPTPDPAAGKDTPTGGESTRDGLPPQLRAALDVMAKRGTIVELAAPRGESARDAQPVARSVQCGDCGAHGEVDHAEDGLLYLVPSGQIGHPRATKGGGSR